MRVWLAICLVLTAVLGAPFPTAAEAKPLVIVNKAINKLALVRDGRIEAVYPVATGVNTDLTPEGMFTVTVKAKHPYYRKKNIPGGAPNNPLGARWIGFNARGTDGRIYGIHGTNNPASIGQYVSQGCVRMHNRDVEHLYERVPIGANVLILRSNESFYAIAKRHGAVR
ncbi:L,D-transpeptidase [Geobacillus thermoleovorans]|uniref:L,D-transpeptidase n=2 Tax=Geobacillus thermoleovorans group TaxID=1505648 RepID=A0A2Z3NCG0_GEOTH|nr:MULTISPECIES: L,D-transpeptidase [Geobacillus]AWO75513.1 L,D-transpeptidase [Geobacillus thermoleovorans]EQB95730.1 L,D-transpeptidase [Geobacillus sp. A8]MED3668961.1 L,D-transpeptidase [Geobacillus kaustophilus]OQP11903.1 L,D-transpeptidase [Geobacillus thermoleovorans]QNU21301.1 L,D-transpeptidase [Geobacillus thermoleovorans]